jgi:hypothetical protein
LDHQPGWADERRWTKAETGFEEARGCSYKIWYFNVDSMVQQTVAEYKKRLLGKGNGFGREVDGKHGTG